MDIHSIYDQVIRILEGYGQDTSTITIRQNKNDQSIVFGKSPVLKITDGKRRFLYLRTESVEDIPADYFPDTLKSLPDFVRFEFTERTGDMGIFSYLLLELYREFVGTDLAFGCCHRYVECSDSLKCIHPDRIRAMSCLYRKNLEAGRIFYGKNKTI